MDGAHIVIEGSDGAGTSTQQEYLAARLKDDGYQVRQMCEPSPESDPVGNAIRNDLIDPDNKDKFSNETIALGYAFDRMRHVDKIIKPGLDQGQIILSDRYYYSSLVYQTLDGVDREFVEEINSYAPEPDLTLFLYVPVEECLDRIEGRGISKTKFELDGFLGEVNQMYEKVFQKLDETVEVVDGDREEDEVHREITQIVYDQIL